LRFISLGFRAFGPFTGLELDLAGGAPGGFHLVLGPNEAGKSSALRGVHDLLFGFPERTRDAHVHPSSELRIAATLSDENGHTLGIQRLKRRKDSLRDERDAAIEESTLGALLGGVDAEVFERLFGLDHERLARAGQALLEDKGDVGESLFDAGSGGPGIRRVLNELSDSADEIFKPRSSKASLNVLLESYKEAKSALRDAQVFPEKWQAQAHKLDAQRARVESLSERRKQLREESTALTRLSATLGPIAQRNDLRERLNALGVLPQLPENARERREEAERTLARVAHDAERLARERAKKLERSAELHVPEELLALSADAVNQLRDRVGDFRKAERDLPRRREDVRRSEAEVKRLALTLYPDKNAAELERLRPRSTDIARVRRLVPRQGGLVERLAAAQKAVRSLELSFGSAQRALTELPEVENLVEKRRVLATARGKGELERRVRDAAATHERLLAQARSQLSALGFWRGDLEAVPGLPVPSDQTIERFAAELTEQARRADELQRESAMLAERSETVAERARAIEGLGSVPSEAALEATRALRDEGFRRLVAAWARREDVAFVDAELAPTPLHQSVARAQKAADEQADRLRREAERVSELAQLAAERERVERERARLADRAQALAEKEQSLCAAWRKVWEKLEIEPESPAEMRAWLGRQRALAELALRVQDAERALLQLGGEHEALVESLARALGRDSSASLVELVAACEEAVERGLELATERKRLQASLVDLEKQRHEREEELTSASQALADWQKDWREATAPFAFGQEPSTEEMTAALDAVSELFAAFDELGKHRDRTGRMEQDASEFSAHVHGLIRAYAPDLSDHAPDVAAEELVGRYLKAQRDRVEKRQIEADLAEIADAQSELEVQSERARAELSGLLRAAGAADLAALVGIEAKCAEAKSLTRELEAVERSLVRDEGVPLEELLAAARGVERPALQVRLREIEEELERLDEEIQDLSAEVRDLEHGLQRYADSDAADYAQNLSVRAAEIREQALRYAKLKLSSVVLAREIERYREQNQGPVLRRANALFPRLTLNRYRGLRVGIEERLLVAVREDGKEVPVDGLSEGTRYQLYLALRIASLERYLERNPPLPLVLDDILIHFDDERAGAALGVLGELAERMQILFFTHHARDRTLAARAIPAARLFNHSFAPALAK